MPFNPFAHLMGGKVRADEGDDDEKAKKAKGKRADEDDYDESAEDGDDDEQAEDDDEDAKAEDDDEEEKAKGKKAKGKKAEDDDDEADARVAKGRRMERKRCAAIFGSKAAGVRPDMAASLAFNTSLSASQAVAQLEMAAAYSAPAQGGRMSLDQRMQGAHQHRLGPDAPAPAQGSAQGGVAAMTALYNQHKGIK